MDRMPKFVFFAFFAILSLAYSQTQRLVMTVKAVDRSAAAVSSRENLQLAKVPANVELENPNAIPVVVIDTGVEPITGLNVNCALSKSFVDNSDPCVDEAQHGTITASLVGGTEVNSLGIKGVAPGAEIISFKIFKRLPPSTAGPALGAQYASTQEGIYAAYRAIGELPYPLVIVNSSWGGLYPDAELGKIIAGLKNAVVVAASGNDGIDITSRAVTPCKFDVKIPHLVCVGAIEASSLFLFPQWPEYANFGVGVDMAAPGVVGSDHGTSLAAPLVAGAIRLAADQMVNPTAAQLRQLVVSSSSVNPSIVSKVDRGRQLDVQAVLRAAVNGVVDETPLKIAGVVSSWKGEGASLAMGDRISIYGEGFGGDARVTCGGRVDLPVFYGDDNQINTALPTDPFKQCNTIEVVRWNGETVVAGDRIGFAAARDNLAIGAILHQDGSGISDDSPLKSGEAIRLLVSGVGGIFPYVQLGGAPTGKEKPNQMPKVAVNGNLVPVEFSATADYGAYALSFTLPEGVSGPARIEVIGTVSSAAVQVACR